MQGGLLQPRERISARARGAFSGTNCQVTGAAVDLVGGSGSTPPLAQCSRTRSLESEGPGPFQNRN
jgi:hypothetical protein